MLDTKVERVKVSLSIIVGCIASMFESTYKTFIALMLIMFIDSFFGYIKAFKLKNWNFKEAIWGVLRKISQLVIIFFSYILYWIFKIEFIIYISLYYFMICEVASIFENYTVINSNIPEGFVNILRKLQYNMGNMLIDKLTYFSEKVFNNKHKKDVLK